MGAAASSSSSSFSSTGFPPKIYDVFISFRGEDTRTNFTSHLYTALCQKNIETYIDYRLDKGDEISPALIQAIQDSHISLVVLSQNYASSKWCLDELIQVLQCRKDQGQFVIPVFYKVDPSDVRKQKGTYEEAFTKHERDFIHNHDKVNMWKNALSETANLAGWDSQTCRDESELIQNIVNDVLRKLDQTYPRALKGLVGIDENCHSIELLLQDVPIIGIWGMGGIGKTTMAKVVFAKLSSQFDSSCFVENLTEVSEKQGLSYVRHKLISELLEDENNLHASTLKVSISTFGESRVSRKKVLIVLDDVSSTQQLDYLARECGCLRPDSRVIITTRNRHVLLGRVNRIYKARALSYHESLDLLCLKAFHKDHPEVGYEQLSKRAIAYAQGIPLVLIVMGSFLYSKTEQEWDDELEKLNKSPYEDIQEVLKLSYDGLNFEEKEMFLDIACFLKGENKEYVVRLFESCGFHATIALRNLLDKALISIDYINNEVWMHDLIQAMGREIVRMECIKEPGRRSRLWDSEEVYNVLKNNKGTDAIESIILNESEIREVNLSADTFKKMPNLRFLKFYSASYDRPCNLKLPFGLESFCDTLRYLHWDKYPLESLPASRFCLENLVEIHMKNSHVKRLWDGVQDLVNLKRIDFSGSMQLMELPDFSKAQKLECVDFSYCYSLCNVHPSILSLELLSTLNLNFCKRLKSLQSESPLKSLTKLGLDYCSSLIEFSLQSEKITSLNLRSARIRKLHSSIGCFRKLTVFHLNGSRLRNLPISELCCLKSLEDFSLQDYNQVIHKLELHILFDALTWLKSLSLHGCSMLSELPDNISNLSLLNKLSLIGSNVERLPSTMRRLVSLRFLELKHCSMLKSITEVPYFMSRLDATGCTSLKTFSKRTFMDSLLFINCMGLDEPSLCTIRSSAHFSLMLKAKGPLKEEDDGPITEFCYPGSRVPEWFGSHNQTRQRFITVELAAPPLVDNLMGFVFCAVLPKFTSMEKCPGYMSLRFYCEDVRVRREWRCCCKYIHFREFNSDHVLVWYNPCHCRDISREVRRENEGDNPKISFEFVFDYDCLIKEFGVLPLYAPTQSQ